MQVIGPTLISDADGADGADHGAAVPLGSGAKGAES